MGIDHNRKSRGLADGAFCWTRGAITERRGDIGDRNVGQVTGKFCTTIRILDFILDKPPWWKIWVRGFQLGDAAVTEAGDGKL